MMPMEAEPLTAADHDIIWEYGSTLPETNFAHVATTRMTMGDSDKTVIIPAPQHCEKIVVDYDWDVRDECQCVDESVMRTLNTAASTVTMKAITPGYYGLALTTKVYDHHAASWQNDPYNVTVAGLIVDPATTYEATTIQACPETIYPRRILQGVNGVKEFQMHGMDADPNTGDYIVTGLITTDQWTGDAIGSDPATYGIIAYNRNSAQHWSYGTCKNEELGSVKFSGDYSSVFFAHSVQMDTIGSHANSQGVVLVKFSHPQGLIQETRLLRREASKDVESYLIWPKIEYAASQANPVYVVAKGSRGHTDTQITNPNIKHGFIANLDADLQLKWVRFYKLFGDLQEHVVGVGFWNPSPAHAQGPFLLVQHKTNTVARKEYMGLFKASDGDLFKVIAPNADVDLRADNSVTVAFCVQSDQTSIYRAYHVYYAGYYILDIERYDAALTDGVASGAINKQFTSTNSYMPYNLAMTEDPTAAYIVIGGNDRYDTNYHILHYYQVNTLTFVRAKRFYLGMGSSWNYVKPFYDNTVIYGSTKTVGSIDYSSIQVSTLDHDQICDSCNCYSGQVSSVAVTVHTGSYPQYFGLLSVGADGQHNYRTKYLTAAEFGDRFNLAAPNYNLINWSHVQLTPGYVQDHASAICHPIAAPTVDSPADTSFSIQLSNPIGEVPVTATYQCQNWPFTESHTLADTTPLPAHLSYDAPSNEWRAVLTDNQNQGLFSVRKTATLTGAYTYTSFDDMDITILPNGAPTWKAHASTLSMYTQHTMNVLYERDTDPEDDLPIMDFTVMDVSSVPLAPQPTWAVVTKIGCCSIDVAFNPLLADTGSYKLEVKIYDLFNTVTTPTISIVDLNVLANQAPQYKPGVTLPSPTNVKVPFTFTYSFTIASIFEDLEGDNIIVSVTFSETGGGDTSFLSSSETAGVFTVTGTPPANNAYASIYTMHYSVEDQYDATPNTYNINFQLLENEDPRATAPSNSSFRIPAEFEYDLSSSSLHSDPESLAYTIDITIDGFAPTDPAVSGFVTWNSVTQKLYFHPTMNSQAGAHAIKLLVDDGINSPATEVVFTANIIQNYPLDAIAPMEDRFLIVGNPKTYNIDPNLYFSDPEGVSFQTSFIQEGSVHPPYFMKWDPDTQKFTVSPSIKDIGTFVMFFVGIDDASQKTFIRFEVIVEPCYFKCLECFSNDFAACEKCDDGYYLNGSSCLDSCPIGFYEEPATWKCEECNGRCQSCEDGTTSNCQSCNFGYFYLNNACYETCPKGYYGDTLTGNCVECHRACTDCFGGSALTCTECLHGEFVLIGTSCKQPTCLKNQFFDWNTLMCVDCHEKCSTCVERNADDCLKCNLGEVFERNQPNSNSDFSGFCYPCEDISGYFTNEDYKCQEICGDGIIFDYACDDGNLINDDGCSSDCTIEYGFDCEKKEGSDESECIENLPPEPAVQSVDPENKMTIQLSEYIVIEDENTLSSDNFLHSIIGPNGPYNYDIIVHPPGNSSARFQPGDEIIRFEISIINLQNSLEGDGSERFQFQFKDPSLIKDLNGNSVMELKVQSVLSEYIYIDPEAEALINQGGNSMKYSFLTVVLLNILLKVALQSSMSAMWGAVHALQIFYLILHMNFRFPTNLLKFGHYLGIAQGDMEEFTQFIPDAGEYLIDSAKLDDLETELPANYVRMEVDTPFFVRSYGQSFTLQAGLVLIVLPAFYILNRICSNIKFFQEFIQSFFFNMPMRAIVELYLEIIFSALLNFKYFVLQGYTEVISSVIAVIAASLMLYYPFFCMSILWKYRDYVNTKTFEDTWGMLTEDTNTRYMMQINYYPIFIYQRFIYCFIIIFLNDYPVLQVWGIISGSVLMAAFLIINRPFKLEKQQTTSVVDEFVVAICCSLFLYFRKEGLTPDEKDRMGWIIISIILISTAKNLGIAVYYGYIEIRDKIHEVFFKSDEESNSPDTSQEFSERISETDSDIKSEVEAIREEMEEQKRQEEGMQFEEEKKSENVTSNMYNYGLQGQPGLPGETVLQAKPKKSKKRKTQKGFQVPIYDG